MYWLVTTGGVWHLHVYTASYGSSRKTWCRRTKNVFRRLVPFMLCIVQFDPPSAEIDIATHRYTFLDVFLYVELIYDVKNDFRVH